MVKRTAILCALQYFEQKPRKLEHWILVAGTQDRVDDRNQDTQQQHSTPLIPLHMGKMYYRSKGFIGRR